MIRDTFDFFFVFLFCSSYWKRMYVVSLLRKLDFFSSKHDNHMQSYLKL